jgi:MYND finger
LWMRHTVIKLGQSPNTLFLDFHVYQNANILQVAALSGDVRLLEAVVALGAALDWPFVINSGRVGRDDISDSAVVLPSDASTLVMACVTLAIADSTAPCFDELTQASPKYPEKTLDTIEECAMQLVRLGADPTRKLHVLRDEACCFLYRIPELDGKSAFQIAAMSKRRALVALMWEHMQMNLTERAAAVHCRCGSRLPWKECHSTGAGQPPPCMGDTTAQRVRCRVSPLARCPCTFAEAPGSPALIRGKPYYKCCWKDNASPTYLMDETGCYTSLAPGVAPKEFMRRGLGYRSTGGDPDFDGYFRDHVRLLRESPAHFHELCAALGSKSKMLMTWDPVVYAGCLERLDDPFFWTDVHWDLDRSVLVRQAAEWNKALQKYCDDRGLEGEEKHHIFETHRANPCGPCGFRGCDAFETKVRQFERCATCKAIAYCSRSCQRKDWAEHRNVCNADLAFGGCHDCRYE